MRSVLVGLSFLTLVGVLVWPQFLGLEREVSVWRGWPGSFWYDKRIFIEGAERLLPGDVLAELPQDRSVAGWLINRSEIAQRLENNPMIQRVSIARCSLLSWGCFVVTITERQANLITMIGDEIWLVGADGGYIAPIPLQRSGASAGQASAYWRIAQVSLPIVTGVSGGDASAEATRLRFQFVDHAVQVIERQSGLEIDKVDLSLNGELKVRFRKFDFPVVFDVPDDNFSSLEDEVKRFEALLGEFKGDLVNCIESVDLAFDKVGVVKLRPPQN